VSAQRLATSRLFHRFGFGPKPGEYAAALSLSNSQNVSSMIQPSGIDTSLAPLPNPTLSDLGPFPAPNSPGVIPFATARRKQILDLTMWWLDRMALADHPFIERATWFWHGHWATSVGKVEYALPMYVQNQTLRTYALGNFADMSRAMVNDPALIYWLDAQTNSAKAPNENLARELMELFTLGVNRYTEDDIKAVAKGLTGYQVNRSAATASFDPTRHDTSTISFLGNSGSYDANKISDLLVAREDCQTFIANRIWFRFMNTRVPAPLSLRDSFKSRSISTLFLALASSPAMSDPANVQVKSPVDWFISVCRALKLQPSKLENFQNVPGMLTNLGQLPFNPPNVGGWPYDEAWLNLSTAQYRLTAAQYLVKQGDLSPIKGLTGAAATNALADWLGISEFSTRTTSVLRDVVGNPSELLTLAICSPEYLVNA